MTQLPALLLSIAIEAMAAATMVRMGFGRADVSAAGRDAGAPRRAALAAILTTAVTHFAAWHAVLALEDVFGYLPSVVAVEAAVVVAESVGYRFIVPLRGCRAVLLSLAANLASTGVGLMLYALRLA